MERSWGFERGFVKTQDCNRADAMRKAAAGLRRLSLDVAVAPVIANHLGARRAGQGRDSGERSERTLDAPKRSRKIEHRSDA